MNQNTIREYDDALCTSELIDTIPFILISDKNYHNHLKNVLEISIQFHITRPEVHQFTLKLHIYHNLEISL